MWSAPYFALGPPRPLFFGLLFCLGVVYSEKCCCFVLLLIASLPLRCFYLTPCCCWFNPLPELISPRYRYFGFLLLSWWIVFNWNKLLFGLHGPDAMTL
jgi:hypothetical protein